MFTSNTQILTIYGPRPIGSITEPILVFCVEPDTNRPLVDWYTPGGSDTSPCVEIAFDTGLVLVCSGSARVLDVHGRPRSAIFTYEGDRIGAFNVNINSHAGELRIRRNARNGGRDHFCKAGRLVLEALGQDLTGCIVHYRDRNYHNLDPDNLEPVPKTEEWIRFPQKDEVRGPGWPEVGKVVDSVAGREQRQDMSPSMTEDETIPTRGYDNHYVISNRLLEDRLVFWGKTRVENMVVCDPKPCNAKAWNTGILVATQY